MFRTGACSGNATLNRCGYCVGGGSKLPETHGEDCNGECNGNAVVDSCGFCVMGSTSSRRYYGSEFKDCNGTCHSPATINKMATNSSDTCFTCLLAGDPLPDGLKDACGVCYGDNSTCKDCDGIPNGGKTLDACGVCGGPGDSCLAVRSVSPSIVPGDTTKTLAIAGAGFDGSLDCLAQKVPSENVTIATRTSALTMVDMTCQFSLKPGDYKIFVRTPDGNLSSSNATLRVYSSRNVIATAVSPMSFTLEGEEVVLNITASGLQAVLCMLSDVPVKGKLTIEGSLSDTGATCTLPRLTKSGNFSLRLSMNAVDLIEGSFELIAFAAAPKVISLKFSKTGAEVIMRFNKMVDTEHLIGCSSIFKNVSKLGDGAICKWPSNFSLRIEVGKGDNLIKPGDSLTFVLNATKVLGEAYSRAAEGSVTIGNQTSLRPRAIITGPAEVPSCGEVELSGERSSGGGGRSLEFTWILDYSDGETENVTKLLKESSRSGGKKRITLVASDLTANRTYRLGMGVRNFFGESGFVTFDIKRESIPKPVVFISSSLDRSSVKSTDRVILTANAQLPVCAEESSVQFLWSVDDPRVRVDETTGTFRKYLIRENTLPSNSKVTFHVRANFQNDSTRFSTASIALNVRETALVAVTNGGHGRRVGVNSTDKVVISANQSYDPDTPTDGPKSLSFVWSCRRHKASEKQFESCFSMLPGETTFPTATERSRSTLEFSPRRLQPNYFYLFKVVVRKDTRNAQREVVIEAVPGSPPQVVMENLPNQIMPNRQLRILMYANSSSPVTVLWMQAYAGEPGHGYINFQDPATLVGGRPVMGNASTKDSYFSFIEIEAGKLLQGMKYGVRVKVKNVNSEEGSGLVMFSVASDVQSCTLMAPENYTVLNTITLDVAGCSTGVSAYPLQYQFFTEQAPGEYRSISSRFFLPRITIPGPPLDGDRGKTTFVVEVCNRFATCKSFSSGGVTVEQQEDAESLKAAIDKGKKELATYIKTGNFIQALVNLVSLIKAKDRLSSVQRTKRDSTAPERDSDELLVLVDRALSQKSSLDAGAAGTIISQMKMLNVSSLAVSDQRRVLLHFQTLIGLFGIDRVSLQLDHLEFLARQIAAADPENGDAVRRTLHLLLLTAPGPFSTPRTFVSPHFALKEKRTMLDGLETFQYGGKTVQISFNAEMKNRYSDWACGSKRCLGLTVRFVSQPRSDQFYRLSDHRKKIVSDIIDISLFSENADPVQVANLTDLIQFVTTIRTQQADGLYRCAYWARNTWSSDTLETKIKDTAGTVQCQTPHLTTFAIIFTPHNQTVSTPASYIMKENLGNNGNKGALIGGIVGGMTGLIVLIVVLVLVIRHFKMKNTKISAINIQPAAAEGT